jgi:hypothetical protein
VYTAPTGTTLPTVATSTLDVAFDAVGYLSEDGITQSIGSDQTEIKAWQNSDIVRKIQTSHDLTYAYTMIETGESTLVEYYGDYTALADGAVVEITGEQLDHRARVLHVIDGDKKIRIVLPDSQVTERGDVQYVNGDAVGYPVTVTAFPDGNGVKAYMYIDENIATSS